VFTRLRTVLWRALLGADAGFRKTGAVKVFANRRSPVFFLSAIVPRQGQLCQTCLPLSTTIKISTPQPAIRAQLEREGAGLPHHPQQTARPVRLDVWPSL
jgi:hypothetical protein